MYNYTPTLINPALVGTSSQAQVIFNYRSQWKSLDQKYNTPLLTPIYPFLTKKNVRKGGIGLFVLSDKTGGDISCQNTGALLSLTYNMIISRRAQLSFCFGRG